MAHFIKRQAVAERLVVEWQGWAVHRWAITVLLLVVLVFRVRQIQRQAVAVHIVVAQTEQVLQVRQALFMSGSKSKQLGGNYERTIFCTN